MILMFNFINVFIVKTIYSINSFFLQQNKIFNVEKHQNNHNTQLLNL